METERFEYVIDANDVIKEVNDGWRKFAEVNGSPALGNGVVGTWLWQHMAGLEVKHLYRTLLERVKETPGTDNGSRGLPGFPPG